ncbi:hypothetical protein GWK47_017098 [Chionoecetes opilio]|uniref:Tesmin/TSO1-like CXC domain-containing protein n=1 Tax=Chionoecetes opilio TaxID=41210 RepID=A0A8J5BYQ4_CHIOP|nr:hypothetical protein GWK47_017098 [Chionoecetes opilio]
MFCAKKGQIESGQLPPCEDPLDCSIRLGPTIRRLSGDAALKTCQTSQHHQQDMAGNSMMAVRSNPMDGGSTSSRCRPFNLISCTCRRTCRPSDCSCILNGLKCTVVCKLQGCSNMVQDDAIVAQDANDSDGDSDD